MRLYLALLLFFLSAPLFAENLSTVNGPVTVEPIAIRELFRSEEFSDVALSPDGKHLLAIVQNGKKSKLVLMGVVELKPLRSWHITEGDYVDSLVWKDNKQFVFSVEKISGYLMKEPRFIFTNNWYVGNINEDKPVKIANAFDEIAHLLPDDPDHLGILITTDRGSYALRIPVKGPWPLQWEVLDKNIPRFERSYGRIFNVNRMIFDSKAQLRAMFVELAKGKFGSYVIRNNKWEILQIWSDGEPEKIPVAFDEQRNQLYFSVSERGEPQRIDALDMVTNITKIVVPSGKVQPEFLLEDTYMHSPLAVAYHDERLAYQFIDPANGMSKVYSSLIMAFPNHSLSFRGISNDDRYILFLAYSDKDPGEYYLFDTLTKKARYLLPTRPWIKPDSMATTKSISYKSRDGLTIHGFLTLPPDSGSKKLPMVLMLHGGPHGVRDYWGFDSEVQLFASRGYAVMQLNFRGSDGYGTQFTMAGYGNWGGKMIDDMIDGVRWVSDQGKIDSRRVCTFGASYGAFAALQAVAKEPEMFRCAVGYAGVYSIPLMYKVGDTGKSTHGKQFLDKVMPMAAQERESQSPAFNADRIKIPVMLIHGENDVRAPIQQFNVMRDRLIKAGNPAKVTVVEKEEGHGFVDLERQVSMYEKLMSFLDTSMGITRQQAASK